MLEKKLKLCDFIEKNSDFFAAPFLDPEKFQEFLHRCGKITLKKDQDNNNDKEAGDKSHDTETFSLFKLNEYLNNSFRDQARASNLVEIEIKIAYRRAIMGYGKVSIVNGDKFALKDFLDNYFHIAVALISMQNKLERFALLWKFYRNQPILKRKGIFEKITCVNHRDEADEKVTATSLTK